MDIRITKTAHAELKKLYDKGLYMKIGLRKSGCCSYAFTIVPAPHSADDKIYEVDGLEIAMEEEASRLLKNYTIDYKRRGLKTDFQIIPESAK